MQAILIIASLNFKNLILLILYNLVVFQQEVFKISSKNCRFLSKEEKK